MMFATVLPLVPVEIDCTVDPFWQWAAASRGDATSRSRTPSTDVKIVRDMFETGTNSKAPASRVAGLECMPEIGALCEIRTTSAA